MITSYTYSWEELHKTAQTNFVVFVDTVRDYKKNFPCEECRLNFKKEVFRMESILPLDSIQSVEESSMWIWLVHNSVNLRLEKPFFNWNPTLFPIC